MALEERSPSDWRQPGGQKCSRFLAWELRDTPIDGLSLFVASKENLLYYAQLLVRGL